MLENVNNFLTEIIDEDIKNGLSERIHTRFPPEPNGYLHIGSAKAIFINWSIAKKYNGLFNLRYDDTNPVKEDTEYVDSIWEDIKWLTGEEPSGGVYYGSDYFETCFNCAVQLIKDGKAYVDDLTQEEMRQYRGSLTEPGKPSPYRDRSVEENLQLFQDMRDGKFADGSKTLRAKIDMASPNMNLRDPAIYRIVRAHHQSRKKQPSAKSRFPQEDAARKEDENGHARNPVQQACKPPVREVPERHAAVERGHGQQVEQPEQGTRAGKPVRAERVRQCGERKAGRRSGEADGGA